MAAAIFREAVAQHSESRVFVGRSGPLYANTLTHTIGNIRGSANFTAHDIRRTVGSNMSRLRVPKEVRERVLNHVGGRNASMTSAVYDAHDYDDEKLEALTTWENELMRIVGNGP
jgi:integrase